MLLMVGTHRVSSAIVYKAQILVWLACKYGPVTKMKCVIRTLILLIYTLHTYRGLQVFTHQVIGCAMP